MITSANQNKDTSLPLALLLLGGVLMGLVYLKNPLSLGEFEEFVVLLKNNKYTFGISLSLFAINFMWFVLVLKRLVTLTQQGSRLKKLRGENANKSIYKYTVTFGLLLTFPAYFISSLAHSDIGNALSIFLNISKFSFHVYEGINFGLASSISLQIALNIFGSIKINKKFSLPKYPNTKDSIVLGSVDEESDSLSPSWQTISRKGLNGNILSTGSIGSGKTSGLILPYLNQILKNFEQNPSIVAIDPKGTFIPEAKAIAIENGFEDKILHITLDGTVSFNPIYCKDPLRKANFLAVAEMIKAASVNFIGKSFDSPFWEVSSHNLVKNCLIYCGAVHGYYTLKDLYSVMVNSGDGDLAADLANAKKEHTFDAEESYNIDRAIEYFENEFQKMDDKLKSGILATSTSFLNQFNEYRASKIFCPPKSKLTITTMDEIVDDGKILLFDINNPGLSKSMGTFVKLHYQQSILDRLVDFNRSKDRMGLLIMDEYQDVVTTGAGSSLGDDRFLAKGREANAVTIAATQSLTSIVNSVGKEKSALELFQNFRTRIAGHSSDIQTIKNFQELMGQYDKEKDVRSIGEMSQKTKRNFILGGFDSEDANITESVSSSIQKEYYVTGKEFSRLKTFESYAQIYDGESTSFKKLYLKPYFLKDKNITQSNLLTTIGKNVAALVVLFSFLNPLARAATFPTVCSVLNSPQSSSCMQMSKSSCVLGWPVPRPGIRLTYYVPQTYIEVSPDAGKSHFTELPGAAVQLASIVNRTPFGVEGDHDTTAYHAHTLAVPFSSIPFNIMPCGGARVERMCFDGMSEHLGSNWTNGSADSLQPKFLAWSLAPKACLIKGAVTSATGSGGTPGGSEGSCSVNMNWIPKYPPSSHEVCNGWGVFYPRSGIYNGPSSLTGALMIGSRMKSLSSEIFNSTPSSIDEKWQMISPQTSSCFREGQNIGILETVKNAREIGRLTSGKLKGHLFVVWKRVSCCRDIPVGPAADVALEGIKAACKGLK